MANMLVKDGTPTDKYIGAEGAGSDVDPYIIRRVLEGGFENCAIEFSRPGNTTPYSALDCLSDNAPSITTQVLAGVARKNGGSGTILRATLKTDMTTWTNPITFVIYSVAPGAFIADNSAFDRMYADKASAIGMLEFPSFQTVTGGAGSFRWASLDGLNIPYGCDAAIDDLYFQAYIPSGTPTPASAQKFYLQLGVLRD